MLGYQTPTQARNYEEHGCDDEDSTCCFIEAESEADANEWGKMVSRKFLDELYKNENQKTHLVSNYDGIEKTPEVRFNAAQLSQISTISHGDTEALKKVVSEWLTTPIKQQSSVPDDLSSHMDDENRSLYGLLMCLIAFGLLLLGGFDIWLLYRGSLEPEEVGLTALGDPNGTKNVHLTITNFVFGDGIVFIFDDEKWERAWIPLLSPDGEWTERPVVAYTNSSFTQSELKQLLERDKLTGVVTNGIKGFGSNQREKMAPMYPGANLKGAIAFEIDGKYPSPYFAYPLTALGAAVMAFGLGIVFGNLGKRTTRAPLKEAPALGKYRDEISNVPTTEEGVPDRAYFDRSASYYAEMAKTALSLFDATPRAAQGDLDLVYKCHLTAEWGLIYAGNEAIPYALTMLESPVPEMRASGASILSEVGKDGGVISEIIAAFDRELAKSADGESNAHPGETLDSMLIAIGNIKSKKAIPSLATFLRDTSANVDSRYVAAESLGKIVRKRFDKNSDPIAEALIWLEKHDH